jgi:chromosome segregation protein
MVEELRPHLRLLKRQTSKWEKRTEIEKELRDLENNYFAFKLAEIKNSLAALNPNFSSLEKEINQRQKELEKFQQELTKIDELKTQTAELLAKRSELQRELGHLEAKLEILDDSSPEVEYQAKDLLGLIKEIKSLLESGLAAAELEKLKVILKNLLGRIDGFFSVREKAAVKREDFLTVKEEKEKILKKLEALNVELSELAKNESSLIESFKTLEEKREELNRLENERNKIIFEKEKLNLKLQDLEIQLNQIGRKTEEFELILKTSDVPNIDDKNFRTSDVQKIDIPNTERRMFKLRTNLAGIGDIDPAIVKETQETEERYQFLSRQSVDLEKASSDLKVLIRDLGRKIHSDFQEALKLINKEFDNYFRLMFGGGRAKLKISNLKSQISNNENENKEDQEGDLSAGIEINLNLPRRRISSLEMLSGGERSLVSIAALFALISVNPPPFLILDEIDSSLDDRNTQRFAELIKRFSQKTQFVIITHNRATMTIADVLYGLTMGEDGTSKVLSLKLEAGA